MDKWNKQGILKIKSKNEHKNEKFTNFTNNQRNAGKKESFYIPLANGQIYYSMLAKYSPVLLMGT